MNATKGEKRLISEESILAASGTKIKRPENWAPKDRLRLAEECRQKLDDCPALTRKGLASQLRMTTARLNQLLSLLQLAPDVRREVLTIENARLSERTLLSLLIINDPAAQTKKFRQLLNQASAG